MAPPDFSLAIIFGMINLDIIGYPLKRVQEGECTLQKTMKKMQLIFSNSIQGKSLALSLSSKVHEQFFSIFSLPWIMP
jgi:hypothetical protein